MLEVECWRGGREGSGGGVYALSLEGGEVEVMWGEESCIWQGWVDRGRAHGQEGTENGYSGPKQL